MDPTIKFLHSMATFNHHVGIIGKNFVIKLQLCMYKLLCLFVCSLVKGCIIYYGHKNICVLHIKFNAEAKVFCMEEFFRWQSMNETSDDSKIFSYNKAEADYSISPPIQCLEGFLQRKYYGWKSAIYISISIVILFVT